MKRVTVYRVEPKRCKQCEYGMVIDSMWACGYCVLNRKSRTVGSKVPKGYCDKYTPRERNGNNTWINTPIR